MSGACKHTKEEHEAAKAPEVWATLVLVGVQQWPGDHASLELRNLGACTLAKEILTEGVRTDSVAA